MTDIDTRLLRGPLRVRNLWVGGAPRDVARSIRARWRIQFALRATLGLALVAVTIGFGWAHRWGGGAAHVDAAARSLAFSDGSRVDWSSQETSLSVDQETKERVVTKLGAGGARFRVVHNAARTFEVRAGDVRVRVLGTKFSVDNVPSGQVQVLVEEGRVEVAWLGGATLLSAGQGGLFPPSGGAPDEPLPETVAKGGEPPVAPPPAPRPSATSRSHAAGGEWREDARHGDYTKAYKELRANGREAVRDDAADLMLAADVARLGGHPDEALAPLRAVAERHGGDLRAPVAAFSLGRVLMDDLKRPADAAPAFRSARILWPSGPLAEDALAREADAWSRAGKRAEARTAASEYIARYARGSHVESMRKILEP